MSARVDFNYNLSEAFSLRCGVKCGSVVALTLFGVYISVQIHCSFLSLDNIALCTWIDGKFFSVTHLKVKTKTNTVFFCELMFVDDAAFCAQSEFKLQEMCDTFSIYCDLFSLQISVQKAVVHATNAPPPCIQISDETLKVVDKFC